MNLDMQPLLRGRPGSQGSSHTPPFPQHHSPICVCCRLLKTLMSYLPHKLQGDVGLLQVLCLLFCACTCVNWNWHERSNRKAWITSNSMFLLLLLFWDVSSVRGFVCIASYSHSTFRVDYDIPLHKWGNHGTGRLSPLPEAPIISLPGPTLCKGRPISSSPGLCLPFQVAWLRIDKPISKK